MPKTRLILIEAALFAAAIIVVLLVIERPFNSGGTATQPAALEEGAVPRTPLPLAVEPDGDPGQRRQREPTPARRDDCGPAVDGEFMAANQILTYYGKPYTAQIGILGQLEPDQLVAQLKAHAQTYDALNGARGVQPALQLVYGTAQADPGREGLYLLYVDSETVQEYIDLACRNRLLIFLDTQVGRSDVRSEVQKLLPFLGSRHVHLALDPEFAMAEGEVPGEHIGHLDAEDVNLAQQMVQDFVEERGLPDKIMVVHQFLTEMLTRPELLKDYPRIRLVHDMDGFGPAEIKAVKYGWYAEPGEYSGIKLFFQQDPDLMSEQDVIGLGPDVVIYQ